MPDKFVGEGWGWKKREVPALRTMCSIHFFLFSSTALSLSLSLYRKFHGPRKEKETGQFVTNRALWAGGGFLEPSLCPRRESGSNFSVNNFYQTLLGVRRDGFLIEGDRTVVLWVLLLCDWSLRNYLDWTLFNQNFRSVSYQCTKRSSPFKVSDLKSLLN